MIMDKIEDMKVDLMQLYPITHIGIIMAFRLTGGLVKFFSAWATEKIVLLFARRSVPKLRL